jgi:hypothetical protein
MSSTNPNDFKDYQVDYLFLLVGENPLPNYVAARLLIKSTFSTVYLVHTTATAGKDKPAGLLEKELKKHNITTKPIPLGDNESDGDKIRAEIKEAIQPKGKSPLQGRIGLNYTGGTKAMAVHAYQAFQELQPTDPVFSYLDSRKLAMHIDGKDKPIPVDLVLSPAPQLETILGLHNLKWQEDNLPISKSMFPGAAERFVHLHTNSSGTSEIWRQWCNKVIQKAQDKNKGWKPDERIESKLPIKILEEKQSSIDLPKEIIISICNAIKWELDSSQINVQLEKSRDEIKFLKLSKSNESKIIEIPGDIQEIFRNILKWEFDGKEINIQLVKEKHGFKLSQIYEWLNSGWLEDYVMWQVEKIASKYQIQEIKRSLHIQDPEDSSRDQDQFEFDVAFLRGYQLFGISCSMTSKHSLCKEKLFEAYLRAKQLGGDEARVALLYCY